ncbi:MAG: electron transfer flavoprotein-quinone oxidoreductase, partial [Thermomicrobiales bacterium]|nr:electron transfer flavoprotein-quinone oxidoreductase [Thermomicrobiales bacterium]
MLDRFKRHPAIAPLVAGGETIEYSAHLIPEGGIDRLPQIFADGVVVVGDAAGLGTPLTREGATRALISGRLAAPAIVEAKQRNDFSIATLSRYQELLDDSIVIKDLRKIRRVTPFAHARPHLLRDYPQLASEIAREYLTVDGTAKKDKQVKIAGMIRRLPKKRLLGDAVGALRSLT